MKKVNLLRLVTRGAVALILLLSLGLSLNAQPVVPDGVNYQAVVRDANTGNPLANTMVEIEVDILDGAVVVNTEFFGPLMTNDFGLVNLVIGVGVDWLAIADPNIEVFVDAGSGFLSMGVTAIESVPYAAVAGNAAYYDGTDIVFGDGTMLYVAPDGTPGLVEANKTVVVDADKDIYGFNNVGVDGALYLGGNLDIANTGTAYIRNNEGATSINTGALRITGGLAAGNDSYFGQDVVIGGDLTVMGSIYGTFYGTGYGDWYGDFYGGDIEADNATLTGDLYVGGQTDLMNTFVDGDLEVTGQGTFTDLFAVSGVFDGLDVIYGAQIGDNLTVGGSGTFGSANVLGGLQVDGQTNVMDIWGQNAYFVNLDVSGTASFGTLDLDYLNVNFDATVGGDLDVGGAGTFASVEANSGLFYDIVVDGLAEIMYLEAYSGEFEYLTVYGPTVLGDVTGEDAIFETMTVNDWLSVGSWGSFGGDLNVDGDGWFGGDLDVIGHGSFDGYGYFGGPLDVVGVTTLQDDLHVWGIGYFENSTPANSWNQGAVRITGGASIGHSLWVGADLHVQNDGYIGDDLYVNDGLSVGGIADMGGVVHIYDLSSSTCSDPNPYAFALEVDGGARIDMDLCVGGTIFAPAIIADDATFINTETDNLLVNLSSEFNGPATFSGDATFNGMVWINDALTVNAPSTFNDDATFNNNVNVNGQTFLMDTWVNGDLEVTGTGTFNTVVATGIFADNAEFDYLDVNYDAWVGGDVDVDGDVDIVGDLYAFDGFFGGDLEAVNGMFSGDLSAFNGDFNGDMNVDGHGDFGAGLDVVGDGSYTGNLQVDGTITSGNSITIDGTNPAYGVISETNDELSFDDAHLYDISALDVDGDGWFGGDLDVYGTTYLVDLFAEDADFATLNVTGLTTLGDLEAGSTTLQDLTVLDFTYLEGTLEVDGATDIYNTLDVTGATFVDNTLDVSGVATFTNTTNATGGGVGAVVIPFGGLYVGLDQYTGGSLTVAQNVTVGDNLTVQDASNLYGPVHIYNNSLSNSSTTGALVVDGGTGIALDLNVGGVIRTGNTLALDGTYTSIVYPDRSIIDDEGFNLIGFADNDLVDIGLLTVSDLQVDNDLNVDGVTTLDETTVDGTLDVTGNAQFDADVNVDGHTTVNTLNATGNVDFDANLNVNGVTTLDQTQIDGILTVNGATDLDGTLNVQDAATFQSTVNVQGNADFDSDVNIDGSAQIDVDLNVDGVTTLNNTAVDGTFDVVGNSTFTGTVGITGNTTVGGTLGVTGDATFAAGVDIVGDLDVDGNTTLANTAVAGTFDVVGNSTFTGDVAVSGTTTTGTLDVTNNATVGGTLGVTGATTLASTLDVTGATTLASTLDVTGATDLMGGLNVDGLSTLDNTTIDGLATVNGDLDVNAGGAYTGKITAEGTIQSGLTLTLDGTYTLGNYSVIDDSNYDLIDFQGDNLQNIGAIAVGVVNATTVNTDQLNVAVNANIQDLDVVMDVSVGNDLSVTGNTDLTGTLTVAGATTLNNTLDVSGIVHITNSTQSADYTTGALVVDGGVGIAKDVFINQNLAVKEELTVDGNALLKSNLTLQGVLAMTKTDNISILGTPGSYTVSGGIIQADGGGYVEKDWLIGGDLYTNGAGTFGGRVEIWDATAANAASPNTEGALWVMGGIATQNNVMAAGVLKSGASITIDGQTNPGTIVESNSNLDFLGTAVNVDGILSVGTYGTPVFTVDNATGNTWVGGTLDATGDFTVGPGMPGSNFVVTAATGDATAQGVVTGKEFQLLSGDFRVAEGPAGPYTSLPWINIKNGGTTVVEFGIGDNNTEYGIGINEQAGGTLRVGMGMDAAGNWSSGVTDGTSAAGSTYDPGTGFVGLVVENTGTPVFAADQTGSLYTADGAMLDNVTGNGVVVGPAPPPPVTGAFTVAYTSDYVGAGVAPLAGFEPALFVPAGGGWIGGNFGVGGTFYAGPTTLTSLTVNPGPVDFTFDGVVGNDFGVTGGPSTFDYDGTNGDAVTINGDLDVNANAPAAGNITAEGTITSGSSIVIDGTVSPGTIVDNTTGIDFTGTPVNVDGDFTVGAYGSNMFKVNATNGEVESYHTDGSLAVAFGPAAGQNDGWLKTYSKIGGGELVILGSNPAGTHGSVFVKDETVPAASYIGAGMYRSGSGYWIVGAGVAGTEGSYFAYSGPNANEARLEIILGGTSVFGVDREGDFFGNDLILNGSFTLGGTTVTGITTAAWTSPGSVNNLVTEAAVEAFADNTYLRQDGTTPLTGSWIVNAGGSTWDITAVDVLSANEVHALNALRSLGALYVNPVATTGAGYVVLPTDQVLIATSGHSIVMPDPTTVSGRVITIRLLGGPVATCGISTPAGFFDAPMCSGSGTASITLQGYDQGNALEGIFALEIEIKETGQVTLVSDGTNWIAIGY